MEIEERIEKIEQASELIREARELVVDAVEDTSHKDHFDAYGQYGFRQLLSEGNPYDSGLDNILEDMAADKENEEEEK